MTWFPRLSPDGQQIITQVPGRYTPVWFEATRWVAARGNGPGIYTSDGQTFAWNEPLSLVGGGGRWAAEYTPGVSCSHGPVFFQGYHPAMAEDGYLVFLEGHNAPTQTLRDANGHTYATGVLEYPSASRGGVAWSRYVGRTQRETWYAPRLGPARRVHASGDQTEFRPVVVTTPTGDWIATFTHQDVRLYPTWETRGYVLPSVDARALDAQWNGTGIRLVWNGPTGTLFDRVQNLTAPRVAFTAPAPPPPPLSPKEPDPVSIPRDEIQPVLETLWADPDWAPRLMGSTAETTARAIRFLTEAVRRAPTDRWGLLEKPGKGLIADILTYRADQVLHADVISGADGVGDDGPETFTPKPAWKDLGPIRADWRPWRPAETPPDPEPPRPPSGEITLAQVYTALLSVKALLERHFR